jgi:CRP-like cAMP-binding protein
MQATRIVSESQVDRVVQLGKVALFAGLSAERLRKIAAVCRVGVFPAGAEIVAQGDDALGDEDGLYIVLDGRVEVRRDATDTADGLLVATLGPREFFGEMALLDGQDRSASVFAATEVLCLMLSRWDFQRQLRSDPEIALRILAVLSRRIRGMLAHWSEVRSVAQLSAGDFALGATRVGGGLSDVVVAHRPVGLHDEPMP